MSTIKHLENGIEVDGLTVTGSTSGISYNDLTNKPIIPDVSDYYTKTESDNKYVNKTNSENIGGSKSFTDTTAATITGATGALTTAGGLYVAGNERVKGTLFLNSSNSTTATTHGTGTIVFGNKDTTLSTSTYITGSNAYYTGSGIQRKYYPGDLILHTGTSGALNGEVYIQRGTLDPEAVATKAYVDSAINTAIDGALNTEY